MLKHAGVLAAVLAAGLTGLAVAGTGPEFLIRVDLSHRADFDRAAALNLEPVYRWGNEFYVVVDGAGLNRLDGARLKYDVIDRDPFTSAYYYIEVKSPFTEGQGLAKSGAQALDQIGGVTLWKTEQPLSSRTASDQDTPEAITGEKTPLRYETAISTLGSIPIDPALDTIMARITFESLYGHAWYLQCFQTRYTFSDSSVSAQDYLVRRFRSFGYTDVRKDTFDVEGALGTGHNIICTKLGTTEPDKVIVLGAHYDSDNSQSDPMLFAPGADDNASGTAALLEIARVLAGYPTRNTIVFVAFGAGEQGQIGSTWFAEKAVASATEIELMINMDMIGRVGHDHPTGVTVRTNPMSISFAKLVAEINRKKVHLILFTDATGRAGSDHHPFASHGYHYIFETEVDRDTLQHTNKDLLLDMAHVVWPSRARLMASTAYILGRVPVAVRDVAMWDVGDGQALEVRWAPAPAADIVSYRVCFGQTSGAYPDTIGAYTDTMIVPAGISASARLDGLAEGRTYFAAVTALAAGGTESAVATEVSLTPLRLPRAPGGLLANSEFKRIELSWDPTVELDHDRFEIHKGTSPAGLTLLAETGSGCSFVDTAVAGGVRYYYRVVAMDRDGNVSPCLNVVSAIPATFDRGVLITDLTAHTSGNPSEIEQSAVYNRIFAGYEHGYYQYDDYALPIDKSTLGQYGSVFWVDDDYQWESWPVDHWAKLSWYLSHGCNLAIAGWAVPGEVSSAGILADLFHAFPGGKINEYDCVGGVGSGSFPSVVFDTTKVSPEWSGRLINVWTLIPADASADVILRYNSAKDVTARETLPVAIRRDTGTNRVALVGVPLYYMREADAIRFLSTLSSWFGVSPKSVGDVNGDGAVDVLDIVVLAEVAFQGVPPPTGYSWADMNGDCVVDVFDIVYLIDHVFLNGPAPMPGCAH